MRCQKFILVDLSERLAAIAEPGRGGHLMSRHHAVNDDWPQSVWAWSPKVGRWQPEHGKPKQPVCVEVSTDEAPPCEAFDYWRNLAYYHFDADKRPPGGLANFKARAKALVTPGGELYLYRSSAVSGQRTPQQIRCDGGDTFNLGLVVAGVRRHRDETDGVTIAEPGELFCYDASKVSRVEWDDHRGLHLSLPRALIDSAVGKPLPPASQLIQQLNRSPLARFLRSHLSVLAREFDSLSLRERLVMFDATVDFLLNILREVLIDESDSPAMDLHALFFAAKRVIQKRMADPNLCPDTIASELCCSRSTLYRAFKAHGMTVAHYIREMRLHEARRRIATSSPGTSIASIAEKCGFYDTAYFRKLFRARFDMNPSDVRALQNGRVRSNY